MALLDVVVLTLATWRLASLLNREDGPFEVFARLRYLLGVRYDEQSEAHGTNWFAKGVICLPCCSVWFGFFWAIAYMLWKDSVWVALPFALSAGAIVIHGWVDRT